MKNKPLTIQFP